MTQTLETGENRPAGILERVRTPEELRALPPSELPAVSEAVRMAMIEAVSQTGGHLGSGLGVVELTVALHYVFDTPRSKFVWDVSHQCYPHKILTGRRDRMTTIRQGGGLAGFTCRAESAFDPFGAAHSSTAVSAALGFATARDMADDDYGVVAIVGDGAMSGGMAFEGLNNLGALKRRMVVLLNDNDMSIAPPSGALSLHLRELRAALPSKETRHAALKRGELPRFAAERTMFDTFGVRYAGPFDGHDVEEMRMALEIARDLDEPVLIHALTVKGKGYAPAEASSDCYHGVAKFDVASGKQSKPKPNAPSYTSVFAKALIDRANRDPKIVGVTAAMPSGTGLDKFGEIHPARTFDVGIAEQHAVTFAAGLAAEGYRPFAAIYSTFLQRGYDQVVHDVAIQNLPVRFMIDRAGMVGADGVTHQGAFDITYLGCLPGFVLMAAADEGELVHMVETAAELDDRPCAVRYPRGEGVGVDLPEQGRALEIGRGRIVREGGDVAILSYGARLSDALEAAEKLALEGLSATVADARFAKPIDAELTLRLFREHAIVATLEEGSIGGFEAQVAACLHHAGETRLLGKLTPIRLPDLFIEHDKPAAQIAHAGLDAVSIAQQLRSAAGQLGLGAIGRWRRATAKAG